MGGRWDQTSLPCAGGTTLGTPGLQGHVGRRKNVQGRGAGSPCMVAAAVKPQRMWVSGASVSECGQAAASICGVCGDCRSIYYPRYLSFSLHFGKIQNVRNGFGALQNRSPHPAPAHTEGSAGIPDSVASHANTSACFWRMKTPLGNPCSAITAPTAAASRTPLLSDPRPTSVST